MSKKEKKKPAPYATWCLREYDITPAPPKPKCKIINNFLENVQESGSPNQFLSMKKQQFHEQDKDMVV